MACRRPPGLPPVPGLPLPGLPPLLPLLLLLVLPLLPTSLQPLPGAPPGVTCPTPQPVKNANIQVKNHQMKSRERYVCSTGFKRKAGTSSLIQCVFNESTGTAHWTNPNIECIRDPTMGHLMTSSPLEVTSTAMTLGPETPTSPREDFPGESEASTTPNKPESTAVTKAVPVPDSASWPPSTSPTSSAPPGATSQPGLPQTPSETPSTTIITTTTITRTTTITTTRNRFSTATAQPTSQIKAQTFPGTHSASGIQQYVSASVTSLVIGVFLLGLYWACKQRCPFPKLLSAPEEIPMTGDPSNQDEDAEDPRPDP
ncbi:interleukin-15 receptor subunit alpha [Tachyglossus aculeatus]|uniref:interleukin-15 receptor subunit alpha n=1 Tax=Tachyglossus aculeatus TaxID=9261 RepID=UPI0018F407AD|nr:interleukin-15 receptor subunit alpha [Tachyglossus aculeatus]